MAGHHHERWHAQGCCSIVSTLNRRGAQNAGVIDRLATQGGNELVGSTPEQFAATIKSEITKYAKIIKEAGIRIE